MANTEKPAQGNELVRISVQDYMRDVERIVQDVDRGARVIVQDEKGVTKLILGCSADDSSALDDSD